MEQFIFKGISNIKLKANSQFPIFCVYLFFCGISFIQIKVYFFLCCPLPYSLPSGSSANPYGECKPELCGLDGWTVDGGNTIHIYTYAYDSRQKLCTQILTKMAYFFCLNYQVSVLWRRFFFFRRIFFCEKRPFLAKKRPKNVLFLNIKFSKQDMIYTSTTICQCPKKTQKKSSRSLTGTFFENLFNQ